MQVTPQLTAMLRTALLVLLSISSDASAARQDLIVVVGAPGTQAYGDMFTRWSQRWEQAALKCNARYRSIGQAIETKAEGEAVPEHRRQLQQTLADIDHDSQEPVWLVLIGHGTFDGQRANFNLRGSDVSAQQLQEWLEPVTRLTIVVNCTSSSGPFINRLSGHNRIVVTATKNGDEHDFTRFGDHLSSTITDMAADLDKDQQVSLLEAYLAASARVAAWYKREARLATEHALLDDNGDSRGTPADWFDGVRVTRAAQAGAAVDGFRASQVHLVRSEREGRLTFEARQQRDRLEQQIEQLRQQKPQFEEAAYYDQLEQWFLELARLYKTPDP